MSFCHSWVQSYFRNLSVRGLVTLIDSGCWATKLSIVIIYYCLSGLDLLGELDVDNSKIKDQDRLNWRNWIWEHATREFGWLFLLSCPDENLGNRSFFGFRSGTLIPGASLIFTSSCNDWLERSLKLQLVKNMIHLIWLWHMLRYSPLAFYAITSPNWIVRESSLFYHLLNFLMEGEIKAVHSSLVAWTHCSFSPVPAGTIDAERDLRFAFCAFAIASMLNDWSGIDIDSAVNYIARCRVGFLFLGCALHTLNYVYPDIRGGLWGVSLSRGSRHFISLQLSHFPWILLQVDQPIVLWHPYNYLPKRTAGT